MHATLMANKSQPAIGCYMLRPFARPVACCVLLGVVTPSLKPVKLLAMCKRTQQLPAMLGVVGQQYCVRLHVTQQQ